MTSTCIGIAALSTIGWIWQYLKNKKLKSSLLFYERLSARMDEAERTIAGLNMELANYSEKKAA